MTFRAGELAAILQAGLLNPLVYVIAFMMGRAADQWQKLVVVCFAAGAIGVAGAWLMTTFGRLDLLPRSYSGVFIVAALTGLMASVFGYLMRR